MKSTLFNALQGLRPHRIVGSAASAFGLRILGAGLQFLFTVMLARFYGASGVGVFVISLSLLVVSSAVVRWGLDQASLKLVAAHVASGEHGHVRVIVAYSAKFIFLSGIAGTLLLAFLSKPLTWLFFEDNHASFDVIIVMTLALLPLSLTTLFAEVLRGLHRIVFYTILHGALIPLLSILYLLILGGLFEGVIAGALAYVSATITALIVASFAWLHAASGLPQETTEPAIDRSDILARSHSFAWVTIISVLMSFTETFMLGLFQDEASVGIYAAALRIALIVNFIPIAFNSILAPNFASLYRQGRLVEMQAMARHSVVIMFAIALTPITLCFLLPNQVLSIFGAEFTQGAPALILLAAGQLIIISCGPVAILLQMTGQERAFRNNVILSAMTTLVTSLLLIPAYGVLGAALSAVIGIFLLNALSLISVRNRLGINPLPLMPPMSVSDEAEN